MSGCEGLGVGVGDGCDSGRVSRELFVVTRFCVSISIAVP